MIKLLIEKLKNEKSAIFIQTHNFPDPDAVASAFGLQQLFLLEGINSTIIYDGVIQRIALNNMIKDLSINIHHKRECQMSENDKIIIVDGCTKNKNVTELIGEEIAVIDHHPGNEPEGLEFIDIRPEVGSCSSIITTYYGILDRVIPQDSATALLTGLYRDTDSMKREVSDLDVEAFSYLYKRANNVKVNSLVLNNITIEDLKYYSSVIKNLKTVDDIAFCYISENCSQNLLGILGDFLLSLEEVRFTALFANNDNVINLSFRNEIPRINAAELMKEIVAGIGSGGGHRQMAGGVINKIDQFNPQLMFEKLLKNIENH